MIMLSFHQPVADVANPCAVDRPLFSVIALHAQGSTKLCLTAWLVGGLGVTKGAQS